MEKMPYQERTQPPQEGQTNAFEWHFGLPTLKADKVTLREVRESDAPALLAMLTSDEVAEFVSPLPRTIEGFHGFIRDVHAERLAGTSFCFAIVPEGYEDAMGLFQVRQLEPGFGSAEWGFALGSPFWGTGVFNEGARAVVDFAFGVVGVHRLEARSIAGNGRGNAALRKMGAMQEGLLRRSFLRNGRYYDQILWSILKDDWRQDKAVWGPKLH
ncbi:MAG TPA: GNAT family N-acetyltransferase [Vicinamibacterales bacterium]|jgi:RimJ/RimL family protein N-acetyltransferase|nr:GNAT family N-acetyltransferase [Vicinamibacterales bacterium]